MAIRVGDNVRCKDGVIGEVTEFHKYGKDYHIVIKTENKESRELNLSQIYKEWMPLFP
jgi:hypothetical protein